MRTYLLSVIMISSTVLTTAAQASRSLAGVKESIRVDHARELLGERYNKSVVFKVEKRPGLEKNILATVEERLPKRFKSQAHSVAETIIKESAKHSLDPYFVMAVISGESSFNPLARGPVGEIGMMQIRPKTGEWMAKIVKMNWKGDKMLQDPIANIKLGTAYLAWLRKKFDHHGQLYLAAYNMGASSVKNAVGRNVWPKDYPRHVMKRYIAFYKAI